MKLKFVKIGIDFIKRLSHWPVHFTSFHSVSPQYKSFYLLLVIKKNKKRTKERSRSHRDLNSDRWIQSPEC